MLRPAAVHGVCKRVIRGVFERFICPEQLIAQLYEFTGDDL